MSNYSDFDFDEADQYANPEAGGPGYEMVNEDDGLYWPDYSSQQPPLRPIQRQQPIIFSDAMVIYEVQRMRKFCLLLAIVLGILAMIIPGPVTITFASLFFLGFIVLSITHWRFTRSV
jgi:hypothetical protein